MRENAEFRSSHRVPHRARRASAARAAIDGVLAALFLLQMAYLYLPIEAHETLGGALGAAAIAHAAQHPAWGLPSSKGPQTLIRLSK